MDLQKTKPGAATPGLGKTDPLRQPIFPTNSIAKKSAQRSRLVDRYGIEHSEAIFKNWSPAAIKAMGIRRVSEGGEQ